MASARSARPLLLLFVSSLVAVAAIGGRHVANHQAEYGDVDGVSSRDEVDDEVDGMRLLSILSGGEVGQPSQTYDGLSNQQDGDDAEEDTDYNDYDTSDSDEDVASSAHSSNYDREGLRGASSASLLMNGFVDLVPLSSWYKGPHVCKRVSEYTQEAAAARGGSAAARGRALGAAHTDDTVAQCYETESAYHCRTESHAADGRKLVSTILLECCDGYRKVDQSCVYVKNLTDLLSTAKRHEGGLFAKEVAKLYPWTSEGGGKNITVFAPLDRHMVLTKEVAKRHHDSERDGRSMLHYASFDELVRSHIVDGYAFSSGFEPDRLISTRSPSSHVRINVYDEPKKLVMANCLPLKSTDHLATNGLLHFVDGVLTPVTSSIWQRLLNDGRFSRFTSLIEEEFPADKLGLDTRPGHFTVFAPTNAAIESANMGKMCIPRTLKRHILPNVLCSRAIDGKKTYVSEDRSELTLQRTASGMINLSGKANIITADIMSTNGVIHVIDEVLLLSEDDAKMSADHLSGFSSLLGAMNKKGYMTRNVTLFIPSKEAINNITKDIDETMLDDPDELNNLIKYHVAPGMIACDKFSHQVNTSLGVPIKMQTYATYPFEYVVHTANCMRIVKKNIRNCRNIVHEVEGVLVPPTKNLVEIVDAHPSLTLFAQVLRKSAIYNELTNGSRHYTIYAPDDGAMTAALTEDLDVEGLNNMVLGHTVLGYKCCAGIFTAPYYTRIETEAGGHIKLLRDASDNIQISGDVSILECDAVGTNGVIHVVNKVIPAHLAPSMSIPHYSKP